MSGCIDLFSELLFDPSPTVTGCSTLVNLSTPAHEGKVYTGVKNDTDLIERLIDGGSTESGLLSSPCGGASRSPGARGTAAEIRPLKCPRYRARYFLVGSTGAPSHSILHCGSAAARPATPFAVTFVLPRWMYRSAARAFKWSSPPVARLGVLEVEVLQVLTPFQIGQPLVAHLRVVQVEDLQIAEVDQARPVHFCRGETHSE